MNINILGYNIFAKGGTSRSNINLIKSFLKNDNNVNYFNILDFESDDITRLIIHEGINNNNVQFYKFDDFIKIAAGDLLIITREELFIYAKEVKQKNKKIKIIGEIHGPLEYIDDSLDLGLEYIDSIRVSTDTIKEKFIEKYKYNSVFSQYVNAEHIDLKRKPINTKRNLLIKARFEDNIKDISYVIKLINYIVKNTDRNDIQLYIIGYGPSELLYKNLVKYYNLQNNVHINEKEPLNYIYISSSPYETLGYSILETLARGNRALIYPGDDNVLEEVYSQYNGIKFLEKNIRKDSVLITSILDSKYTKTDREEDVNKLNDTFLNSNYSKEYVNNLKNIINNSNMSKEFFFKNKYGKKFVLKSREKNELKNLNKKKEQFKKMKSLPILNKIFSNKFLNNKLKEHYKQKETNLYKQKLNEIIPQANKVFIESFHGNNFSGDPKYIALGIKNFFKDKEIFVSSINSLVDIEIRNHGFKPVRFGSKDYIEKFRMSKYIFINGNSWDKVYKHKDQVFIQTWHGFPLKKMVSDLSDEKEKNYQLSQFKPRMYKWDYLITSSNVNSMLLSSAFQLHDNKELKILEYGAPKNEYLLKFQTDEEWRRLQRKYLFMQNTNKKYILYCPTWRKQKRNQVTSIDLKKLLAYLPNEYEIIVKLHPNESSLRPQYNNLDHRIHCFYNEFVDIQELYILSDIMITDYSSTIFDFAHLNKPIFLMQEDMKDYNSSVGFYFNIFELGNFPIASLNEYKLALQIKNIKQINYSGLINRLMCHDNENSTKKILNEIF